MNDNIKLIKAVISKDIGLVRRILSQSEEVDINYYLTAEDYGGGFDEEEDEYQYDEELGEDHCFLGYTPLMIAIQENNVEMTEYLLRQGADVNETDCYDDEQFCYSDPLFIAITNGNKAIVELLLKEENIDFRTDYKFSDDDNFICTALILAAEIGNKEIVEMLLDKMKDKCYEEEKMILYEDIVLDNLKKNGQEDLLKDMAKVKNRVVNYYNTSDDFDALIMARKKGHIEIVKTLLKNENIDPEFFLRHIIEEGDRELIEIALETREFLPHEAGLAIGYAASASANLHNKFNNDYCKFIIDKFLEKQPNVNFNHPICFDEEGGQAPLCNAVDLFYQVGINLIDTFLELNCDPNYQIINDFSSLEYAAHRAKIAKDPDGEALNKIITQTAILQKDNGNYWLSLVGKNQLETLNSKATTADTKNNQDQQLSQLDNEKVLNFLNRQTVTMLAVVLPDGDLKNKIIDNFNQRNDAAKLDCSNQSDISRFKELKNRIIEKFNSLSSANSYSSSSASVLPSEQEMKINEIEAISAVSDIIEKNKGSFNNIYINQINDNPRLSKEQNEVVKDVVRSFLNEIIVDISDNFFANDSFNFSENNLDTQSSDSSVADSSDEEKTYSNKRKISELDLDDKSQSSNKNPKKQQDSETITQNQQEEQVEMIATNNDQQNTQVAQETQNQTPQTSVNPLQNQINQNKYTGRRT